MTATAQAGLFGSAADAACPLADRMQPRTLDEFIGQEHILGPGKPLRAAIEAGRAHSMIFWGPPGTGKTILGRLVAHPCQRLLPPTSSRAPRYSPA